MYYVGQAEYQALFMVGEDKARLTQIARHGEAGYDEKVCDETESAGMAVLATADSAILQMYIVANHLARP